MMLFLFKSVRFLHYKLMSFIDYNKCLFIFKIFKINYQDFKTLGVPFISVTSGSKFIIGQNFKMNNTLASNPIGRHQRCIFFIGNNATLIIGDNVGMSQTAIVCHKKITLGNNIKIGGGVCIYDTDFHSLDFKKRAIPELDKKDTVVKEVIIMDNVFIGAHSIILKGVTIGENSIIGAGSVVTKNVPSNEIWAGNPAKFIKNIPNH